MNLLLKSSTYLLALMVFVAIKIGFKYVTTEELRVLLEPTNRLIEFFTNSNSVYIFQKGFYHEKWNILIDKSCSGVNFLLIGFLMLTFLMLPYITNKKLKWAVIPLALSIAYFITILVNTSRILIAIFAQNTFIKIHEENTWLHQAEGSFVYLSSLVFMYLVAELLLKKTYKHYA